MFVDDGIEGIWVDLWRIVKILYMFVLIRLDNKSTIGSMVDNWYSKPKVAGPSHILCKFYGFSCDQRESIPIIIILL